MINLFLKVNKDLFKLGLNPTEILLLAQIMEFQTNTGDCFISNDVLAENFGVSAKTISRSMKVLEDKELIVRDTKNAKGGKVRHITVNIDKINSYLSKDKLSLDNDLEESQRTNCPLIKDKMSLDKGQNDSIKDNIIDKEKDNRSVEENPEEKGSIKNPIVVSKEWLMERHNSLTRLSNGLFMYNNNFYKMEVSA